MSNPYASIQPAPARLADDERPGARSSHSAPGDLISDSPFQSDPAASATQQHPGYRALKRQRTLVQIACETCRKKKQKCDAVRPTCSPCEARGLECIYRQQENEPRGQALRTQVETLQTELSPMAELFALLRSEPEQVAQDILRRIRLGNDVRTVLSDVNVVDMQMQEIGELYDLSDPLITSRRLPFQRQDNSELREGFQSAAPNLPEKLVDSILSAEQIEAFRRKTPFHVWPGVARWTRLTDSDALVSHLIHVYYEHQQWVCDFNNRTLFLHDFTNGKDDFCSELLVNSILANACRASPLAPFRNDPWNDLNPGKAFFLEAKRLWLNEEANDTVVLVTASLELVYYHYANGQDKIGDRYLYDSIRIARNLGLFRKVSVQQRVDQTDKMAIAKSVAAWALFDFVSLTRLSMQLEPLLRTTPCWAFPYQADAEPRERFHMKKWELSRLENRVSFMLYGNVAPEGKMVAATGQTEGLYQALMQWYQELPEDFGQEGVEPHLVLLKCRYHHCILALFRPFITAPTLAVEVRYYKQRAIEVSTSSTRELRSLVEAHMVMEDRNIFSYHYCPMVACNILDEFRRLQNALAVDQHDTTDPMYSHYMADLVMQSPSYPTFLTCLKHLFNIGSSLYMSQLALRAVQTATERSLVALPYEVWEIFHSLNEPQWMTTAKKNVVSSFAPGMTAQDADGSRIDELIEGWRGFSIETGEPVG